MAKKAAAKREVIDTGTDRRYVRREVSGSQGERRRPALSRLGHPAAREAEGAQRAGRQG